MLKKNDLPVINGLGEVPVGSIPTNNLKIKIKKDISEVS
jgi:hypothetical protein